MEKAASTPSSTSDDDAVQASEAVKGRKEGNNYRVVSAIAMDGRAAASQQVAAAIAVAIALADATTKWQQRLKSTRLVHFTIRNVPTVKIPLRRYLGPTIRQMANIL